MSKSKTKRKTLAEQIRDLLDILRSRARVIQIIRDELTEAREKFAVPRRTEILDVELEIESLHTADGPLFQIDLFSGESQETSANMHVGQVRMPSTLALALMVGLAISFALTTGFATFGGILGARLLADKD